MNELLARNWWVLVLRGVAAIAFGALAFIMPEMALVALVLVFAAYLFLDGILAIVAGLRAARHRERSPMLFAEGGLGIAAALFIALFPAVYLVVFVLVAAIWAVLSGVALIVAALRLRGPGRPGLMLAAGALSVAWGGAVLIWPAAGVVVWAWWLGAYAVTFGALMLSLGLSLRRGTA